MDMDSLVKNAPFFPDKDGSATGKPIVMYVTDLVDSSKLNNGTR